MGLSRWDDEQTAAAAASCNSNQSHGLLQHGPDPPLGWGVQPAASFASVRRLLASLYTLPTLVLVLVPP